jgi:hypothetical protein
LFVASQAMAATWYVRIDGGDATQCDGRSDAAYPGSGQARACAWKHPFVALPPLQPARIAGGDTLLIGRGSYAMGYGAPDTDACDAPGARNCVLAPIPGGPTPDRPTRLLGAGHDAGCKAPPELWATERARSVLRIERAANIEIACLDITDHSPCIKDHNRNGHAAGETARCRSTAPPYGPWGEVGLYASDARNVRLRDLHIHGLAVHGIRAGRLQDWTLQRVRLRANGWAGWDGNLGGDSGNHGRMVFSGGEIAWNGCGERYPSRQAFGCWAQQQGGYGDGLGTARSGGDWLFEDLSVHHNTSDGLDLLYMDGSGSVTIRRVRAEGNAGNQLKVAGRFTLENSIAIGNCAYFAQFPTSNLIEADHCRAMGNTVSITPIRDSPAVLRHNTLTGQGDCLLVTSGGGTASRILVQNNAFIGGTEWRTRLPGLHQATCAHHAEGGAPQVVFERNLFWQLKGDPCPPGNVCGRDPKLAPPVKGSFVATPLPGSPLIDSAKPLPQVNQDFHRQPRPRGAGAEIGAVEVRAKDRGVE